MTSTGGTAGDLAIPLAAGAAATGIAELAGAANMGTALAFGQMAFAAAIVWVITRRAA